MKTNSATGMTSLDKKSLKASEICKIIKACKVAGVHSLSYNGLELEFTPPQGQEVATAQVSPVEFDFTKLSEKENPENTMRMLDEDSLMEMEESQLLIDDPLAFEKSQERKSLERNRELNGQTYS